MLGGELWKGHPGGSDVYYGEVSSERGRQTHTHRCPQDGETDTPKGPYVAGHTHPQGLPTVRCLGF